MQVVQLSFLLATGILSGLGLLLFKERQRLAGALYLGIAVSFFVDLLLPADQRASKDWMLWVLVCAVAMACIHYYVITAMATATDATGDVKARAHALSEELNQLWASKPAPDTLAAGEHPVQAHRVNPISEASALLSHGHYRQAAQVLSRAALASKGKELVPWVKDPDATMLGLALKARQLATLSEEDSQGARLLRIAPQPTVVPQPRPAHLVHEHAFVLDKAESDRTGLLAIRDEDGALYAIGKRGWMPLPMAAFLLGGSTSDGLRLISQAVSDRLWLGESAPAHASWLAANDRAIGFVARLAAGPCGERPSVPGDAEGEGFDEGAFSGLPPIAVSMELRTMWRRHRPHQPTMLMCSSAEHARLNELPWMRLPHESAGKALDQLLAWTAGWFEARGVVVDRDNMLVAVEGYEPLFYRIEYDCI